MKQSEQLDKLAPALAKAQAEMGGAVKESNNPFFKSKYADLTSVWKACKESLHSNGLAVIQSPVNAEDGRIGVATMLLHTSGQFISGEYTLGVKKGNDPQADGSSITYARRYALAAFVGVCPVDDDGEAAMQREKAKKEAAAAVENKVPHTGKVARWIAAGAKEILAGGSAAVYWSENKVQIKKDCGEDGAKEVYKMVIK